MHALVTGAAGFIGSHLSERILADGHSVRGIDGFTAYYDPAVKRANVQPLLNTPGFSLVEADLRTTDIDSLLDNIDVIYHLAGQPGVRSSWAEGFAPYVEMNVLASQRLLDGAARKGIDRFVYASSSSVYGNANRYPTTENDVPHPHSPYGVTKLAAEHLAVLYAANFDVPTVSLRYFTVFGPRQRPEMAMHQLFEAALDGRTFPLFGTGEQVRDFTYVADAVEATYVAGVKQGVPEGAVVNVAGGAPATMNEVVDLVGKVTGNPVAVERSDAVAGDVSRTGGSTDLAQTILGWTPQVSLEEGLRRQADWQRARRSQ